LIVPDGGGSRLRVADQVVTLQEGKCLVFDDSFEHEAWNDHLGASRIVLIVDVWHPDLHEKERKFFEFMQKSSLRAAKKEWEKTGEIDCFYGAIREAPPGDATAIWKV
jgi:aspartate beta-hydroxylase